MGGRVGGHTGRKKSRPRKSQGGKLLSECGAIVCRSCLSRKVPVDLIRQPIYDGAER